MKQLFLILEFLILFFIIPLLAAFSLTPSLLFPGLLLFTLLGILLLGITPEFRWKSLWGNWVDINWKLLGSFSLVCLLSLSVLAFWVDPENIFYLPINSPRLWIFIMIAYPIISVVPQELIYRPLFFIRYKNILPSGQLLVLLNAICFCLIHLFYWNFVALFLTLVGGIIFSQIYHENRNFLEVVLYHSAGGCIIFTTGLGRYFYSGAIQ
tara:strand:- start:320 stop:949 length:630 start_codon:yes stop_codon:yes gene_type:complete